MSTDIKIDGNEMTAFLDGEIDHHNAPSIREKIDSHAINFHPQKLILDFQNVSFMDSSGIGLVMGRYKTVSAFNCTLEIHNLSLHAYKVMRLAGMDKLATLSRKPKEDTNNETA